MKKKARKIFKELLFILEPEVVLIKLVSSPTRTKSGTPGHLRRSTKRKKGASLERFLAMGLCASLVTCKSVIKYLYQNQHIVKPISFLYCVTFFVILPLLCIKMQFSIYNLYDMDSKEGIDQLISQNEVRIRISRWHKEILKGIYSIQNMKAAKKHVDLAITVVTAVRNRENDKNYQSFYLTQVVWKFLWLMTEAERSGFKPSVLLSVCNVEDMPSRHKEAMDLDTIVPVINKYASDSVEYSNLNIFEKEKQDYVFCLNHSLIYDPKFVLLVEDDAYPNDDLFFVLQHVLYKRFPTQMSDLSSNQHLHTSLHNIMYIKLYHPERLQSYISLEPDRLTELFGVSAFFGTMLMLLCRYFVTKLTHSQVNMIWVSFTLYVALVAMAVGRPHLVEFRRLFSPYLYSYVSAPDCCTPAMLFPHNGALQVINHLNTHVCYANNGKDTALDQFIRQEHRNAYIVQPNLFKHIGFFSSLRKIFLPPHVVK